VVISGALKTADVKKLAEEYLEPIPAQPSPPKVHIVEPPQTGERRITVQKDVATPYLMIAWHVPASKDKDYYALDILSAVLSSGQSSRLYSSLVDQQQVATQVFTDYSYSFDPTIFTIYAVANKDVETDSLEKAIYDQIENIKKEGISERELQKIKNQKLMEFYSQIETINGKSNNIGTYEVFFGDYHKMFDAPANYDKISVTDVQNAAKKYFTKSNRTVGILKTNVEE
jgi:predicted Zn-dependent peptidase